MNALEKVPDIREIRNRLDKARTNRYVRALKFQYITGARVSEVCGQYAIRGGDFTITYWSPNSTEPKDHPVIIFNIKTSKRRGKVRRIALPLEEKYEPWTRELKRYFERRGENKVFKFSTRSLQRHGREIFKDFYYPIEVYTKNFDKRQIVPEHTRELATHGLRHIRATDLLMNYGFDQIDLTIFMGWSFRSSLGGMVGASIDRYVMSQWSRYISKLFKRF